MTKTDPQNPMDQSVQCLKGVGPGRAALLDKLGIHTLGELLHHLPRDYEDRRHPCEIGSLRPNENALVQGTIRATNLRDTRLPRKKILEVYIGDDTGVLPLIWFNAGSGWGKGFKEGASIIAYGQVGYYTGMQMVAPVCQVDGKGGDGEFGCIVPVYPLTEGLTQKSLRGYVRNALEIIGDAADEIFPQAFLEERKMPGVSDALREAHFPTSEALRDVARRRLAYEELFVFQTALALLRRRARSHPGVAFRIGPNVDRRIRQLFPFPFTEAQERCIVQVRDDMRAPRPMNRLLQGDVGCGKTAVAIYAMLAALADSNQGYQAALMAPTEILAEQHYLKLRAMLGNARVRMALLKGAAGAVARREGLAALASGEIDLVVGTHALIQDDVEFRNLAMVVVDEQHRFGVRQRLALRRKGLPPDVLIMTATPIPRTLALTYFADVDVSVIDEMPPGRSEVTTELLPPSRWPEAFQAAHAELKAGNRVFVVYPLVEENADLDLTSAKEGFEELRRHTFPNFECCLLHGQMKSEEKQATMEGFRTGKYQVMAATTVVEVGIDVPEATVMIIQHAERLGLAQLHQLRGRIGRGQWPGHCYLLADPHAPEAQQRLSVLVETNDGFKIAEEDLRLRGPGQILGTRQSGLPDLTCYDFRDTRVLERAQTDARALIAADPDMAAPEHAKLRDRMLSRYGAHFENVSAG